MKVAWKVFLDLVKRLTKSQIFWYVFFALAAFFAYKRFTKPPDVLFLDTPLPNNGSGIPEGWQPNQLADNFHDFFSSWFADSDKLQVYYVQANALTDDQFVQLCKYYNAKYAKRDGNKTLYTRVKSWWAIWYGSGVNDQDKFINRMVALKQDY